MSIAKFHECSQTILGWSVKPADADGVIEEFKKTQLKCLEFALKYENILGPELSQEVQLIGRSVQQKLAQFQQGYFNYLYSYVPSWTLAPNEEMKVSRPKSKCLYKEIIQQVETAKALIQNPVKDLRVRDQLQKAFNEKWAQCEEFCNDNEAGVVLGEMEQVSLRRLREAFIETMGRLDSNEEIKPFLSFEEFRSAVVPNIKEEELKRKIQELPAEKRQLLKDIIAKLHLLRQAEPENKMKSFQLAAQFTPVLFEMKDNSALSFANQLVEKLINNPDLIS